MKKPSVIKGLLVVSVLFGLAFFQNCSVPGSSVAFSGQVERMGGTTTDNPMTSKVQIALINMGNQVQIGFCVGSVTFSPASEAMASVAKCETHHHTSANSSDAGGTNSSPFDSMISNAQDGVPFTQQPIQDGNYAQATVALETTCAGQAVVVVNSHGTFKSAQALQMVFSGSLAIQAGTSQVNLDVGHFASTLSAVTSDDQIAAALSSAVGQVSAE